MTGALDTSRSSAKHCLRDGPALLLIFHFGDDALRLAEILLMEPLEVGGRGHLPVTSGHSAHQQIIDAVDVLVSTCGRGRPAAAASFMQSASLKTTPSKRSTAGLRICVLGAPPSGREISSPSMRTATLSCAPASERRMPSSPASSGRFGSSFSMPRRVPCRRACGSCNCAPAAPRRRE